MTYLLDTNVFIAAKDQHYGFDFCPAFWDWLILKHAEGRVFSIEKVESEILALHDDLSIWARARGNSFFLRPTQQILSSFQVVSEWVLSAGRYEPSAVNTFLGLADYYLIAHAHSEAYTVVSHEVSSGSAKKIKIPDVCIGLNIPCILPFEMLRRERARFILE